LLSGNNSEVECDLAKVEVAGSNPVSRSILFETFEKCSVLSKAKEGENFNHPSTICRSYGAGRNTLSILRINPPKFGGGLKFESDPGIG
jgi:hypothetical protein